jgi:hypothetical protein
VAEGYQLRHKEWGVFQGEFLGLGFWHPMSNEPEQGFYRFETEGQAIVYRDFLCSEKCRTKHTPDEFTIESFDGETSQRLQDQALGQPDIFEQVAEAPLRKPQPEGVIEDGWQV